MVKDNIIIKSSKGLHLRPAGLVAEEAIKYNSRIIINYGYKSAVAKSLLSLLSLGVKDGAELEITCEGEDEEQAIVAIRKVLEKNMEY